MNLTVKQISIMRVIAAGNAGEVENSDRSRVDLDQLLDRIDYETSKASIQFSIRSLIKSGMIVKSDDRRRGRLHVTYVPTEACHKILTRRPAEYHYLEDEEGDSLLAEMEAVPI